MMPNPLVTTPQMKNQTSQYSSYLIFAVLVHYILLAIPDTLFFLPAFPFSDYCLKRRKVQSATDRPKKS